MTLCSFSPKFGLCVTFFSASKKGVNEGRGKVSILSFGISGPITGCFTVGELLLLGEGLCLEEVGLEVTVQISGLARGAGDDPWLARGAAEGSELVRGAGAVSGLAIEAVGGSRLARGAEGGSELVRGAGAVSGLASGAEEGSRLSRGVDAGSGLAR